MLKNLFLLCTLLFAGGLVAAVPTDVGAAQPAKKDAKKFPRGHKLPSKDVSAARHRVSNAKYAHHLKALPVATQAAYDAYAAPGGSCVPPIGDQGQCGDCYIHSGTKVCSAAQMVAGVAKPGSGFMLSPQWALDCHPELGGCDGGDEYQVSQTIQSDGAPSMAQYAGAGNTPGRPKPTTGMTLYTVSSLVYCDPTQTDQGVASTQSIKNAILAYGYVSVAVAAGSGDWDAYQGGVLTGRSTGIDHAVGLTGWDDTGDNGDGTKGHWLGDNQWSEQWGIKGRFKIKYGADSIGTEAYVALVTAPTPPPAPTPVPPVPTPTPTPVPVPTPGSGFTGTLTYSNGTLVAVTPGGAAPSATVTLQSEMANKGVNPLVILAVLQLVSDLEGGTATFSVVLSDVMKIITAFETASKPGPVGPVNPLPVTPSVGSNWQFAPQPYSISNGAAGCANGQCQVPQQMTRPGLFQRLRNR